MAFGIKMLPLLLSRANDVIERPYENQRSSVMKHLLIPLLMAGSLVALTATEASAVVYCAAGVYRAGCVARPAAVVVAPRAVVVAPRRAVVVAPRRRVY